MLLSTALIHTGDIIGVIFNQAEKTISYTKNGINLGVAFRNVCEERLYPTVPFPKPMQSSTNTDELSDLVWK